jgi:hypothetical protein
MAIDRASFSSLRWVLCYAFWRGRVSLFVRHNLSGCDLWRIWQQRS